MTKGKAEILADLLQEAREELVNVIDGERVAPMVQAGLLADLYLKRAASLLDKDIALVRGFYKEKPSDNGVDPAFLADAIPVKDGHLGATEDS